jgi:Limiting CO2-inducible proteins B/C beta carbonyic anhydrases
MTNASQQALHVVRQHYPEAMSTGDAVDRMLDLMRAEYGLEAEQLLLADSICADDVNSIEYPRRAFEMLGPFRLGGLNGFPHAGLTGMGAFAGHVPDDGAVVIYHAPHVGITRDGVLGSIRRKGQHRETGCCGAARAALAKLQAGTLVEAPPSDLDYQQETIEQLFLRFRARILGAEVPLREATEVMYEAIAERIDLLTSRTRFTARYLVRFGGILVNGDHDMGSFSVARRLIVTDLQRGTERDLAETVLA